MARASACFLIAFVLCVQPAWGFGAKGHRLIGAIADELLARKPQRAAITELLEGLTLADAAVIADDVKHWGGEPQQDMPWTMKPNLRREMHEFIHANAGSFGHTPNHHDFHFTDISIVGDLKYASSKTGAGQTDVVHMIRFCTSVLRQPQAAPNKFKITPRVAAVLLAHYIGDIHQPLHVGAAYFDPHGHLVDPDQVPNAEADHGGNDIQLHLTGSHSNSLSLHAFWDVNAVDEAIHIARFELGSKAHGATLFEHEIRAHYVDRAPAGAPLDHGVAVLDLGLVCANEILPVAKEVHRRLAVTLLPEPIEVGRSTFKWKAVETPQDISYTRFAGQVADRSIHKAGWRLAALMEKLF